ncbi:hypothetical protein BVRB_4g090460 [Beta vulgaris subsp. vulgaris]|nr:hypothetical protein BVRB_4g090460 [Beta vulgaris subsp. vulgaris]
MNGSPENRITKDQKVRGGKGREEIREEAMKMWYGKRTEVKEEGRN